MAKYNGHPNWGYWNVALWIGNDEGLYNLAKDTIHHTQNRDEAAEQIKEALTEIGISKTPDGANYSKSAIRHAIRGL